LAKLIRRLESWNVTVHGTRAPISTDSPDGECSDRLSRNTPLHVALTVRMGAVSRALSPKYANEVVVEDILCLMYYMRCKYKS